MEMPGLRLTVEETQRLCGVDKDICQMVLDTLVDAKVLCVTNGVYARLTEGRMLRPRPAKATSPTPVRGHEKAKTG
jgi:hypothetical protein